MAFKATSLSQGAIPEDRFGPKYLDFLNDELGRICERHSIAETDDELWLADFQYVDCVNEMTRAKVEYASSIIDQMEGYELTMVRDHLNQAIAKDETLRRYGVS